MQVGGESFTLVTNFVGEIQLFSEAVPEAVLSCFVNRMQTLRGKTILSKFQGEIEDQCNKNVNCSKINVCYF